MDKQNPLYNEAWKVLYEKGYASTSLLQRRLKISYAEAYRLIDQFEDDGIVEMFNPRRLRKVLKAPPEEL